MLYPVFIPVKTKLVASLERISKKLVKGKLVDE